VGCTGLVNDLPPEVGDKQVTWLTAKKASKADIQTRIVVYAEQKGIPLRRKHRLPQGQWL